MDDLNTLRAEINQLDDQLFALLAKRFSLSNKIRIAKSQLEVPIFDPKREEAILNRIPKSIYQDYVKELYQTLFTLSKQIQEKN